MKKINGSFFPFTVQIIMSSPILPLFKSVQWFCRCGWSKIALLHYFGHWLTTACTTVQAVISQDIGSKYYTEHNTSALRR